MKQTKNTTPKKAAPGNMGSLFDKGNLTWMLIGVVVMAIGFLLMAGGKSNDPNVFNPNEVYGARRITIAPIFILAGLVIEIYAIFRSPKTS
ncbi:MAG TPA: DUF3098 domain-containing protein [Flavisolibacter sp.]|nr:DUF3098 domain-containing protein [Flavisolibacter sp.]